MSTDHQRYSTANQAAALARYAEAHGLTITRTYADEGKSGVSLKGRRGLRQLISDVQDGRADFTVLLVFDVSRWGRFQDADESAYYEYLCRKAGVTVTYCAEPFENDGTPIATIFKSVKRAMAGEFSRELSAKVFAGHVRLTQLGYNQGGLAAFGYRRQLVDGSGGFKALLRPGERKSLQDDRVILVPGPQEEAQTVRWIFEAFALHGANFLQIAKDLNSREVAGPRGRPWTPGTVKSLLTNEKYIGNNVYGRYAAKLKQPRTPVPPESWIRCDGAHPPLVDAELFNLAQRRIALSPRRLSSAQMLEQLRELLARHGKLSTSILNAGDGPCASTYAQRFGSLGKAFELVGFQRTRNGPRGPRTSVPRSKRTPLVAATLAKLEARGAHIEDLKKGVFAVNGEFTFAMAQARPDPQMPHRPCWNPRFRKDLVADFRVVARLGPVGCVARDYFIIPAAVASRAHFRLLERPAPPYAYFCFRDLEPLLNMGERVGSNGAAS